MLQSVSIELRSDDDEAKLREFVEANAGFVRIENRRETGERTATIAAPVATLRRAVAMFEPNTKAESASDSQSCETCP